jgi:hypothetical protein
MCVYELTGRDVSIGYAEEGDPLSLFLINDSGRCWSSSHRLDPFRLSRLADDGRLDGCEGAGNAKGAKGASDCSTRSASSSGIGGSADKGGDGCECAIGD